MVVTKHQGNRSIMSRYLRLADPPSQTLIKGPVDLEYRYQVLEYSYYSTYCSTVHVT